MADLTANPHVTLHNLCSRHLLLFLHHDYFSKHSKLSASFGMAIEIPKAALDVRPASRFSIHQKHHYLSSCLLFCAP